MRTFELGEVLASRTLQLQPASGLTVAITVALGMPVKDTDSRAWLCPFRISGLGDDRVKAIFGIDAMQALILCLHTLPAELQSLARNVSGSILDDDWDLGLTHACRTHLTYSVDS